MKLYVFYFSKATKEVVRDEVEVEDKPKSYKTPAGYCLPYLEVSKFLKADTDKIYLTPTFQRMATLKKR